MGPFVGGLGQFSSLGRSEVPGRSLPHHTHVIAFSVSPNTEYHYCIIYITKVRAQASAQDIDSAECLATANTFNDDDNKKCSTRYSTVLVLHAASDLELRPSVSFTTNSQGQQYWKQHKNISLANTDPAQTWMGRMPSSTQSSGT